MEIRVAVRNATTAGRLVQRLSGELDGAFVSLEAARSEVHIQVMQESGHAVVRVLNAVEDWLDESDGEGAVVRLDGRSYTLAQRNGRGAAHDVGAGERARLGALEAENEQLRTALHNRIAIEQAKGVLAGQRDISLAAAFELLRRAARNSRRKVHSLATDVVAAHETAAELTDAMPRVARAQRPTTDQPAHSS